MKVALIGASGFVGKATLTELLNRDHEVTAIVRNPANVSPEKNVTAVSADVFNEADLTDALAGHDAVISTYNAGWTNPNMYDDYLNGSKAVQAAVKKSGVKRFIVVGGAGSLYIAPETQIVDTDGFPADIKPGALAARDYLNIIKEDTDLDWTFLSPAIEMHPGTSGTRTGAYRTGLENPVLDADGRSVLSVEDTAVALVDELEKPEHIQKRFTAAY
ncbi:MAG: NAD(P)-dependent oxidoreductase [Bacteroidota bacterium]